MKAPLCGAFFMSGIYVHIPFCNSKCAYCGFYSVPSVKRKAEFLAALKQEIVARKEELHGERVETVYFGGGTPSILLKEELDDVMALLRDVFEIGPEAEITVEANPDTLSPAYLAGLRIMGMNRLSIGIQSFFADTHLFGGDFQKFVVGDKLHRFL